MAEENKTPIVIRTQVYLDDADYFCNKSWTMSYNLNTKSWISFHSYLPNFYIGENNFFYSGLNGCCDVDGVGFQAVAGTLTNKPSLTTTTTTYYPPPSTTSTTTTLDCNIDGRIIITDCNMDGTAVITVPATTTTTVCYRPSNLSLMILSKGYTLGKDPEVIFTNSKIEACDAIPIVNYIKSGNNIDSSTLDTITGYFNTNPSGELQIGNIVYYGEGPYCQLVPDGWYIPLFPIPPSSVYYIVGGTVVDIVYCDCSTTTTTTTIVPNIQECCGILFSSNDNIYYNNNISLINQETKLDVPGYISSLGIAMTTNYLWSIDTTIEQWDIALSPFSATYNTSIALPMGYTAGLGIVAKNNGILIAIDDSSSPQDVVELDITGVTAVSTVIFSLQADRTSIGNMLYTTDGKLIVINQDGITSDYYITQYDYTTGTVEVDLNIGSIAPTSLYECNCDIYVTDEIGNLYIVIKIVPYVLFNLGTNVSLTSINSATQVASCVVSSITDNITTTTTSSSSSTTTTTTTL